MKRFNYLQHNAAVEEILKHKWIESKKAGRDIGFVSAAMDWIKCHGESWRKSKGFFEIPHQEAAGGFDERRRYRRLCVCWPVKIQRGKKTMVAELKEYNHRGASIVVAGPVAVGDVIVITASQLSSRPHRGALSVKGRVVRSSALKKKRYLFTAVFDDDAQRAILAQKPQLFN